MAVEHRKAVVVFGDRHDIAGAGCPEQLCPIAGIEGLGLQHRDEVLVAKPVLRPVGLDVMLKGRIAFRVHVAGVPLTAKGRDGVDAPMDEDAELGICIPLRDFEILQRTPVRPEGAVAAALFDFGKPALALGRELADRLLPGLIALIGCRIVVRGGAHRTCRSAHQSGRGKSAQETAARETNGVGCHACVSIGLPAM